MSTLDLLATNMNEQALVKLSGKVTCSCYICSTDCYTVNHCLPIADGSDCAEGVTVTVIGVLDDPSLILTITSINSDDSEATNCPNANSTSSTNKVKC